MQLSRCGLLLAMALTCTVALTECGGGTTGAGNTPLPSPANAAFGQSTYATVSGVRGGSLYVSLYPAPLSNPLQTIAELGGAALRFDSAGILWFDQIGYFTGFRSDGTTAGTIYGIPGSLLSFGAGGDVFVGAASTSVGLTGCCYAVATYNISHSARAQQFSQTFMRAFATADYPCSAAGAGGRLFVSTCKPGLLTNPFEAVSMYSSFASGNAVPLVTNATATGPVTVDRTGDVFAIYGANIGVWLAGDFSSNPPDREVPIGSIDVFDLAVDLAGDIFVAGRAATAPALSPVTLYYVPVGTQTLTMLQNNVSSVAAPL